MTSTVIEEISRNLMKSVEAIQWQKKKHW
jgi:hypothetical protein